MKSSAIIRCVLCCLLFTHACAKTFYVSNSGNDSNPGTSPAQPWKTLSRVQSVTSWRDGDTVLLERGSIFYETLTLRGPKSGLTVSNYGSSTKARPLLSGAYLVPRTAWSRYRDNIWQARIPVSVPSRTQVYYKGSLLPPARTKLFIESSYVNATVYVPDLVDNYAGAVATARRAAGTYVTCKVVWSGNGTVVLDTVVDFRTASGWGLFFWNRLDLLTGDTPAWVFDSTSSILYLTLPNGASPFDKTTDIISVSVLFDGVTLIGTNNAVVDGLAFSLHRDKGVELKSQSGSTVRNSDFFGQLGGGISVSSCTNSVIASNTIRRAAIGILAEQVRGTVIENNTLTDVGYAPKYTLGGVLDASAISVLSGANNKVIGNTLTRTGGFGIRLDGVGGVADSNFVDGACGQSNDCGAFYSFGTSQNINITNNIFQKVTSDLAGSAMASINHGVYLDNAAGVTTFSFRIVGNTFVSIINKAVFLKGTALCDVTDNVFYGNLDYAFHILDQGGVHDVNFVNNLVYIRALDPTIGQLKPSFAVQEQSKFADYTALADYSNNVYAAPCAASGYLFRTSYGIANSIPRFYSFAAWQTVLGRDDDSTLSPVSSSSCYKSFSNPRPVFSDSGIGSGTEQLWQSEIQNVTNGILTARWKVLQPGDAKGSSYSPSAQKLCKTQPCFLLRVDDAGGCLWENRTKVWRLPDQGTGTAGIAVSGSQTWRLAITYTAALGAPSLRPLRVSVAVMKDLVRSNVWSQEFVIDPSRQSFEIAFTSQYAGSDLARVELETSCQDPVVISKFELSLVDSVKLNPERGTLFTNPSPSSASYSLASGQTYMDLKTGTPICNKLTLGPYRSAVLAKAPSGVSC